MLGMKAWPGRTGNLWPARGLDTPCPAVSCLEELAADGLAASVAIPGGVIRSKLSAPATVGCCYRRCCPRSQPRLPGRPSSAELARKAASSRIAGEPAPCAGLTPELRACVARSTSTRAAGLPKNCSGGRAGRESSRRQRFASTGSQQAPRVNPRPTFLMALFSTAASWTVAIPASWTAARRS